MKKMCVCFSVLLSVCLSYAAQPPESEEVALTVYNDNFGVVKERRMMTFEEGLNTVRFTGVASQIDPTSVSFTCLSAPDAVSILEQNYEYDLVNTESLLKRYIDQEVMLQVKGSGGGEGTRIGGVLSASVDGDLILQDPDTGQVHIVGRDSVEQILLVKKPEELVTRPTLLWLASAKAAGPQRCEVTYTTGGISWQADYLAVLDANDQHMNLSAWVTVNNQSGASYPQAALKLIAGDVRRVTPPQRPQPMYDMRVEMAPMAAPAEGFEEKAFMEYHMYTLGRKTDIRNNQVKQIEMFDSVEGVPVKKTFVYETASPQPWMESNDKVQIKMELENAKDNHLGMPLPKGKVRVFKQDPADTTLEFVGEDLIEHTAKGEKISLYIGNAFDINAEQKIVDSQQGDGYHTFTRQVEIRNSKPEAVEVFVEEKFSPWQNVKIRQASHKYEKKDAFTMRFAVPVEAGQKAVLEYEVHLTW